MKERRKKEYINVTLACEGGKQIKAHKMAKTSAVKVPLEDEVKTLQKHMGLILKTVKDLKCTVEALDKRTKENEEIKEIIKTQKVIEEVLVANSDAIKRIDREIVEINSKKARPVVDTVEESTEDEVKDVNNVKKAKRKCKYFNGGYCKYKQKCRYFHPTDICEEFMKKQKCERKECHDRHPRECKWERSNGGCKRNEECDYLHVRNVNVEVKEPHDEVGEYECEGCNSSWNDERYIVKHVIRNMNIVFCLNCNDWIKDKEAVLHQGWTLLDEAGFLRNNV